MVGAFSRSPAPKFAGFVLDALDRRDVDPMFVFNLAVAFSSLVMAWVIVVMAIKGWAVYRRT